MEQEIIMIQKNEIYDKYKGEITCAYKKDIKPDTDGQTRCFAKRTKEREKYIFNGITEDMVLIECPTDVLVIEFEKEVERNDIKQSVKPEKIKEWISSTEEKIKEKGMNYCIADHKGTSPYIYCFNLEGLENSDDKKLLAKEITPEDAWDFTDKSNLGNTLIPIIDQPHWKPKYKGEIHKIIGGSHPLQQKNDVSWFKPERTIQKLLVHSTPKQYLEDDVSSIKIQEVIGLSDFKKDGEGYNGVNPFHGSSKGDKGTNLRVFDNGVGYCRRCDASISGIKALALSEGIIFNCYDDLKGEDFLKAKEIATDKGLISKQKEKSELKEEIKEKSNTLNIMSIRDMEKYKPDKNYIIQDILKPKQSGLVYAPSTHLKSLYILLMCLSIASGKKFLNKFRVKKQPVLLISAEDSIETNKKRLKLLMRGLKIRKKDIPLYILPRPECEDIMGLGFQCQLEKTIEDKGIKVLCLDTVNPLTPEIDDNSGRDVTKVFNKFIKPLCDDYGISVLFLHHTTKSEKQFLGSMKWKANSENVWRLERKGLTGHLKVFNEKGKDGESSTLDILVGFEEKEINFKLMSEGKPEIYSKTKKMTQVDFFKMKLDNLVGNKEIPSEDILEIFDTNKIGYAKSTLYKVIKEWRET